MLRNRRARASAGSVVQGLQVEESPWGQVAGASESGPVGAHVVMVRYNPMEVERLDQRPAHTMSAMEMPASNRLCAPPLRMEWPESAGLRPAEPSAWRKWDRKVLRDSGTLSLVRDGIMNSGGRRC